jgi:hypothetical protein
MATTNVAEDVMGPRVPGAFIFARVPTTMPTHQSVVLSPSGERFAYYRGVSVGSSLVWVKRGHLYEEAMTEIARRTDAYLQSLRAGGPG